ncbi:ABC transporter ATP-binding protein [Bifidobacterium sp. CP2]|uniref:dipeptide ABC transporter ATP-binding protein n=1 Tax=Bifidobacterium sp. CP2 TaxID=2809025 RepID=UPI001BDCB4C8
MTADTLPAIAVLEATSPQASPADDVPAIAIEHLTITYVTNRREVHAVKDASFTVARGRTAAIVGESGSGKSTIADALLGILPSSARTSGKAEVLGHDLFAADEDERRSLRGKVVAFVPQDPQTSLDPTMKIGAQIDEVIRAHQDLTKAEARERTLKLLSEVGFDDPKLRAGQYPHELSGGLKQRVLIAAALASDPDVIVADEPTSALDVTVQKKVLDLLDRLVGERGITLLMITHDLAVAADRTDTVIVMNHGVIVEQGPTARVLEHPRDPYTVRLLESAPAFHVDEETERDLGEDVDRIVDEAQAEADGTLGTVEWRDVTKLFKVDAPEREFAASNHVSLKAEAGRTLAIVGESGSGKTTLLRMLLALEQPTSGTILVEGQDVSALRGRRLREARRNIQLVQQNPFDSIDPRMSIRDAIEEPLKAFRIGNRATRDARAAELIERVALPQSVLKARAGELSGGQCQRVAIARALAIRPRIIVLDEPVSALDVTVQAQILDLLAELQRELGLTYIVVSHDLAVVAQIADHVAVIEKGNLVEQGTVAEVLGDPKHAYTRRLVDSIPGIH